MGLAAGSSATLRRTGQHALVIAHRGASATLPENTISAFRAAWDDGAQWVEADTQPTADGVPVILHDDTLDRTTSGSGPVRQHAADTLAELEILGLPGANIPSLGALLNELGPPRMLLLEIKGQHRVQDVRAVLDAVTASPHDQRVFVQSFEVPALCDLKAIVPARPFGLLVERLDDDPLARCRQLGASAYNPEYREIIANPGIVPVLRAAGISVAVWTADNPAEWELLTAAGVDAIITNTPAELLAWQAGHA